VQGDLFLIIACLIVITATRVLILNVDTDP